MKKIWHLSLIIFAMVLFISSGANAATYLDPALKWKTIETLHFKISYYAEIEDAAIRMAAIAEEVHSRLSPLLKHVPSLKTDIVLMDTNDYTNGFATVFPNPLITVYLTDMGSNLQPYAFEEWLRFVFTHEYTHLLNLDTDLSTVDPVQLLLGRAFFPNAIAPQFMIEGLAVYMETEQAKGGRGHDPRWLAMLRMNALDNNFNDINQAAVTTVKWPMGNTAYLYGVSFYEYLSKTYGKEKIYQLSREYGDYLFAYGMDGAFQKIFGKNIWELWTDWQEALKKQSLAEKEKVSKFPITSPQLLTQKGYYSVKPKWGKDSKALYYAQMNADEAAQLKKIDINSKKSEKIMDGMFYDDALWTTPDYLYYTKADICDNFYIYKDIYAYDLKRHSIKRLTKNARASDPAVSSDGKYLAYVKNSRGTRSLWLNDKNVGSLDKGVQYYSPQFSPDDKTIAVAKWFNGIQKIYLVNPQSGVESPLVPQNLSLEANPCYSPDGKYILFDADFSGILNLYAVELKTKKIYRVTNVLGMATMPDVSPDGKKIAFVHYSSKGYDLALIDYDPKKWKEVKGRPDNAPVAAQKTSDPNELILSRHDYNPLPSLIPKFWYPYSFRDENGGHLLAHTAGVDALYQQQYFLQAGMDWKAKRPTYKFYYYNNQFLPQIGLTASDNSLPFAWNSDTIYYWERQRDATLSFSFFDNRVFSEYDRQSVTMGYEFIHLSNISSLEILTVKPSLGNLSGLGLSYRYSSLRAFAYSVAPEQGVDVTLAAKNYSKEMGSNYNIMSYSANGSAYLKTLLPHNVIGLSAQGNLNYGDTMVQSGFSFNYLSLRGYPAKLLPGTKAAKTSLEYFFPLGYPENGFGYGSTFIDRLWATLFFDMGGATYGAISTFPWKRSYGAEMSLQTINAWNTVPILFKVTYAMGIDAGGEEQMSFTFSL